MVSGTVDTDDERKTNADAPSGPLTAPKWLYAGSVILDPSGCVLNANAAWLDWLGLALEAARGCGFAELLARRFPEWKEALARALANEQPFSQIELTSSGGGPEQRMRVEFSRHDGVRFVRMQSVLPHLKEIADAGVAAESWQGEWAREMSMRLLRAETQLDNLVHRWPGVIFSQRPDFTFSFVSPKIEEMTGVPAAEWRRQIRVFWEIVHEADVESLHNRLERAEITSTGLTSSYRIRHIQTGRVIYIWEHRQPVLSSNGLLLGYEGIWLDITRQTLAEKRLSTMAWKENFGVLTMGLAHDLSNVMAGILALSEAFETELSKDHPFQEGLALIKRNAVQASQMVRRVRQLHEGKSGEKMYQDLNALVEDLTELVRKTIPRRIVVETELAMGQLPVYMDAVEFRQAVINLALNAVDAMPNGGRIVFRSSRHCEPPVVTYVQGKMPRLPCVGLAVQDTGLGIPACYLGSVFDPFFTTKPVGKGSGLGLYNARLFVEKHHGAISVESKEKQGATFTLWLPEADFTEGLQRGTATPPRRHALLLVGRAERPLDPLVEFLRENGCYVVAAMSEENAAELLHSPEYQFTGVIVQARFGDSGPLALLDQVRQERLPVKTILNLVGCHPDDIEAKLLERADLVTSQDMALPDFLTAIRSTLDAHGG
jgi:PAS domain S-box-containing protein